MADRNICRFFARGDECHYGDTCRFAHDGPGRKPNRRMNRAAPRPFSNIVCHLFARGQTCPRGAECNYRHENENQAQNTQPLPATGRPFPDNICRYFARRQVCPRGDGCRFSHEQQTTQTRPPLTSSEHQMRAWRMAVKTTSTILTPDRLSEFFQEAQKLVDSEAGIRQQVIQELASEGGFNRICQAVGQNYQFGSLSIAAAFTKQICPLFRCLTHPEIVMSALMEEHVSKICGYVYGLGGKRLVELYKLVTEALKCLLDSREFDTCITLSLQVIAKIIDMKTEAQVNESLHDTIEKLNDLIMERCEREDDSDLYEATKLLSRVQYRMEQGIDMPAFTSVRLVGKPKATFTMQRNPPGGRHSNDFEDIDDVEIMPTYDEIISTRTEYLPHFNLEENHVGGLAGLLDRHFRLLREDTVGQTRDAAKVELDRLQRANGYDKPGTKGAKIYSYKNLRIEKLLADTRGRFGFIIEVSFDQPERGASKAENETNSEANRRQWWVRSKRLKPGALVCLVDAVGIILFCTVAHSSKPRNESHKPPNGAETSEIEQQFKGLYSSDTRAVVCLTLEEATDENLAKLLALCKRSPEQPRSSLVELPGVLLPAFKPTLLALQEIKKHGDLALSQHVLPRLIEDEDHSPVPPPAYSQKRGFRLNLRCLMKEGEDLFLSPGHPFDVKLLVEGSGLDHAQAVALVDALCRCVGLIQGPPGTGKSFVGVALIRVLLDNREAMASSTVRGDVGPIIIVTYTNHAGDQLGEHLHQVGVDKIIRIGSQSKSEILQDCNLRVVARNEQRTKHENWVCAMLYKEREEIVESQFDVLDEINYMSSAVSLKDFVRARWPDHYGELFEKTIDEVGFQKVKSRRSNTAHAILNDWVTGGRPRSAPPRSLQALFDTRLAQMSTVERRTLLNAWETSFQEQLKLKVLRAIGEHQDIMSRLAAITEETNLRCLRTSHVVILTTSGLARNLGMLRKLNAKVLLCEEAGEVLEAHLLAAFLPSIEHAILIGDHEQLRPQVQNHDLSSANPRGEKYSLDISLFERLVHPAPGIQRLPYSTLETQRRMDPSISQLIRNTLYPALKDAENVKAYPRVAGLRKRLFWLDHREPEAGKHSGTDKTSHWNPHEIDMVTELVRHVVKQGEYRADEIAVLTPYQGQLSRLQASFEQGSLAIVVGDRDLEDLAIAGLESGVETNHNAARLTALSTSVSPIVPSRTTLSNATKLATVDNFQGEEAKIVILSLVRSNSENKCGFLKTSNRINVALSRAKHGMIIIGNSQTASARVEMWAKVSAMLEAEGNIGPSLELQCPRHPETILSITMPDDFPKLSPEGGCGLKCVDRLHCGHSCPSRCHSRILHAAVTCAVDCPRSLKGCNHLCPLRCGDACSTKCEVEITDSTRILSCGHEAETLPCWQAQNLHLVKCMVKVSRTIPGCNHTFEELCHIDVSSHDYACQFTCGAILPCGHTCEKKCFKCTLRTVNGTEVVYDTQHENCQQPCRRPFSNCAHSCDQRCHAAEPCPPCKKPCANSCSHSHCVRFCSEPCRPCADTHCVSGCEHSRCTLSCSAPCNHVPCEERCKKFLSCGHQCSSICGEACPPVRFCHTCTKDTDITTTVVDFIEGLTYQEIDPDSMPLIFPSCGHFLTVQSMDGQMFMGNYYEKDVDDKITGLKPTMNFPFSIDEIKRCSQCRGSLRSISRYGRLIRRAMLDEATKRFIVWSKSQYMPLAKAIHVEQDALAQLEKGKLLAALKMDGLILAGSPEQQMNAIRKLHGQPYLSLLSLRLKIIKHRQTVDVEEQPFKQVLSAVQNQRRRWEGIVSDLELDDSLLITSAGVLATSLLLRCELLVLSDLVAQCQLVASDRQANDAHFALDFSKNKKVCDVLVASASASSNPLQACEGHVFFAHFTALELQICSRDTVSSNDLHKAAVARLDQAKMLKERCNNQTRSVHAEIESIDKMLNGGTFYTAVTSEEMRAAFAAMTTEFSGTGHWYTCANGHPFTIGECGMPMEEAHCPQCGATIGGQHHRAVAGTTHATDLEQLFGNLAV